MSNEWTLALWIALWAFGLWAAFRAGKRSGGRASGPPAAARDRPRRKAEKAGRSPADAVTEGFANMATGGAFARMSRKGAHDR